MKLLALDTSTEWCSAAVWLDGEVRSTAVPAGQTHSRILLPMLQQMLDEAGIGLQQLDGLAFGHGPGSFTGLRIACGVIQGLALGTGLPVLGVGTLEAMAEEAGHGRVITALDARVGEIYAGVWERGEAGWQCLAGPALYKPEEAPLPPAGGAWLACGSAFSAYAGPLAGRYGSTLEAVRPEVIPHARSIAALAAPRLARGEGVPAEDAEPSYVRDKVALKRSER